MESCATCTLLGTLAIYVVTYQYTSKFEEEYLRVPIPPPLRHIALRGGGKGLLSTPLSITQHTRLVSLTCPRAS